MALTNSLAKNGETVPTDNIPMGNFKHTNVANAAATNQYAAAGQVQNGSLLWGGTAGGTSTALTISLTPAIGAYAAGQRFAFIAASNSGGATTLAVNGLATQIVNNVGWQAGEVVEVVHTGTTFYKTSATSAYLTQSDANNQGMPALESIAYSGGGTPSDPVTHGTGDITLRAPLTAKDFWQARYNTDTVVITVHPPTNYTIFGTDTINAGAVGLFVKAGGASQFLRWGT